jgi:hypothetical protein
VNKDNEDDYWLLYAMQTDGNIFIEALAQAWRKADRENAQRIEGAFGGLFHKYRNIAQKLKVQTAKAKYITRPKL